MRDPNIIITGTPGTGKSSHAELLLEKIPSLNLIDIQKVAKENDCVTGYDKERKSDIIDEDKLVDVIEPLLEKGGVLIDWHVCDAFPEELIDLIVVLRTNNTELYDRLKERGYHDSKIEENIDAEIMQVILQDAHEAYDEHKIVELVSESVDDLEQNVERIVQWRTNFLENES